MFRRLLSALTPAKSAPQCQAGSVPAGMRVYAVGDIHGRFDLLQDLLRQIEDDDAAREDADTHVIFLGDLVDRGPDSAQVVDALIALAARSDHVRFLLGNHEEVFLKALAGDERALRFFVKIGGRATILSYGVTQAEYDASDYPELMTLLQARVPERHVEFLSGFEDLIVLGDYAFVHAGIRPELPLDDQSPETLRWIREEFLDHDAAFEKIIVHGHTIFEEVAQGRGRIGLDTGAYATGRLTAMGFEGDRRWLLQTNGTRSQL